MKCGRQEDLLTSTLRGIITTYSGYVCPQPLDIPEDMLEQFYEIHISLSGTEHHPVVMSVEATECKGPFSCWIEYNGSNDDWLVRVGWKIREVGRRGKEFTNAQQLNGKSPVDMMRLLIATIAVVKDKVEKSDGQF